MRASDAGTGGDTYPEFLIDSHEHLGGESLVWAMLTLSSGAQEKVLERMEDDGYLPAHSHERPFAL
jgi:DNA-binding PadR family transcriptional regulator